MGEYHHPDQETNPTVALVQEFKINGSRPVETENSYIDWNLRNYSSDTKPSRKQHHWLVPMLALLLYGAIALNIKTEDEPANFDHPLVVQSTPTPKPVQLGHIFPSDNPCDGLPKQGLVIACFQAFAKADATATMSAMEVEKEWGVD